MHKDCSAVVRFRKAAGLAAQVPALPRPAPSFCREPRQQRQMRTAGFAAVPTLVYTWRQEKDIIVRSLHGIHTSDAQGTGRTPDD